MIPPQGVSRPPAWCPVLSTVLSVCLYLCFLGSLHKQPVHSHPWVGRTPIPEGPNLRQLVLEEFQGNRHTWGGDSGTVFLTVWVGMERELRWNPIEGDALAYTRALVL